MDAYVNPQKFVRNPVISRQSFQRQHERPVRGGSTSVRAGGRAAAKGRVRSCTYTCTCTSIMRTMYWTTYHFGLEVVVHTDRDEHSLSAHQPNAFN